MKVSSLLIGKHNSTIRGKNYRKILGRPLCEYGLMAANNCKIIKNSFVSTDSHIIKDIALSYKVEIIDRPMDLAKKESPTELVFSHGYNEIKKKIGEQDYLVLMFANSPDIIPKYIEKGLSVLEENQKFDSVISLCKYNMFTPLRARKINNDKTTSPRLDLDALNIPNSFDRDAMGDIYFADFAIQIVRPERCLINPLAGNLPFRWLGKKQGFIKKDFGFDIDEEWQFPVIEKWLKDNGFSRIKTPYDKFK